MAWDLPTNFTVGNATQSVDGVGTILTYAQYATEGWFGYGVILMIFLISLGIGFLANIGRAFASAMFIAFVFSVYFARIDAVNPSLPFILLILTIIGFFWAKSERNPSY